MLQPVLKSPMASRLLLAKVSSVLNTPALHVGLVKAFVRVYFPDAVSDEPICWT